jgi:hypothetical protein
MAEKHLCGGLVSEENPVSLEDGGAMPNIIESLAEGGAKGLFSGIGQMAKDIRTAITGKDPAKEAEAMQKLLELEFMAQQAQTKINEAEAQNPNLFVSGWRPAVGWTCAFALVWHYVMYPFAFWMLDLFNKTTEIPSLETGELMTLLFGMLGFGGLRTYEKVQGVARK